MTISDAEERGYFGGPIIIEERRIHMEQPLDLAKWLETIIHEFIKYSPENTIRDQTNEKVWDDPLVGFSRGRLYVLR